MNLIIDMLNLRCLKEFSEDKFVGKILVMMALWVHILNNPLPPPLQLVIKATISYQKKHKRYVCIHK